MSQMLLEAPLEALSSPKKARPPKWEGRTVVYRYDVPARFGGKRADVSTDGFAQMRLGHDLRNRLVEIWRDQDNDKKAIWLTRPEVAELEAHLENVERAIKEATTRASQQNMVARSRSGVLAETRNEIRELKAARKELRVEMKAARDLAYEALEGSFGELLDRYNARVKATYADFVQTKGLYWATYNAVLKDFEISAKRVAADRKQGHPAQMRFHRFAGESRIAVQLQRMTRSPARTQELLESEVSPWRNVFHIGASSLPDGARARGRQSIRVLSIRIGSGANRDPIRQYIPVYWHRDLPEHADVTGVELIRVKRAGTPHLSVCLTIRIPATPHAGRHGVCGVDIGWRALPDGSIRIATWHGIPDTPIVFPAQWADAVTVHSEGGEVRIPARWIEGGSGTAGWRKIEDLQSIRGKHLEVLRADLLTAWAAHPDLAEITGHSTADLARWRSPGRFVWLKRSLAAAETPPPEFGDGPESWRGLFDWLSEWRKHQDKGASANVYDMIETWRKQDRHLWEWQAHQAAKVVRRRARLYRTVARILAGSFGTVATEEAFTQTVTRRPTVGEDHDYQADRARAQARIAASAMLVTYIAQAASRDGTHHMPITGANTTRVHRHCGGLFDPEELREKVCVTCSACFETVDQDYNAAGNIADLATAGSEPPAPS